MTDPSDTPKTAEALAQSVIDAIWKRFRESGEYANDNSVKAEVVSAIQKATTSLERENSRLKSEYEEAKRQWEKVHDAKQYELDSAIAERDRLYHAVKETYKSLLPRATECDSLRSQVAELQDEVVQLRARHPAEPLLSTVNRCNERLGAKVKELTAQVAELQRAVDAAAVVFDQLDTVDWKGQP